MKETASFSTDFEKAIRKSHDKETSFHPDQKEKELSTEPLSKRRRAKKFLEEYEDMLFPGDAGTEFKEYLDEDEKEKLEAGNNRESDSSDNPFEAFLDEFARFIVQLEETNLKEADAYADDLKEWIVYAWSENLIDEIPDTASRMSLISKFAESRPLFEHIFPYIAYESAINLGRTDPDSLETTISKLKSLPPGKQMTLIRTLPLLSMAVEFDDEAKAAQDNITTILDSLAESDIAILRYSALNAKSAISNDTIRHPNPKERDTLPINRHISPDADTPYRYSMKRIAADTVALCDELGTPYRIGTTPAESIDRALRSDDNRNWERIKQVRERFSDNQSPEREVLIASISDIAAYLFTDHNLQNPAKTAEAFADFSDTMNPASWEELLDELSMKKRFESINQKQQEDLLRRHSIEHDQREKAIIRHIISRLESEKGAEDTEAENSTALSTLLSNLQKESSDRNYRNDIHIIEEWVEKNRDSKRYESLASEIGNMIHGYYEENVASWNSLASKASESRSRLSAEWGAPSIDARIDSLLAQLAREDSGFVTDLTLYLDKRLKEAKRNGEFIEISFRAYKDILADPTFAPFEIQDENSISLLQNLHGPNGSDLLGMDFSQLPLRAQIQFLLFRGKEKTSDAERFRLALGKHREITDDLAYSFLATAESPEYGETILTLAERFDTDTLGPILRRYAEITKDTDAVAEYVRESFPNIEPAEVEREALEISKKLLRRGRDLLVEFSQSTDTDSETLLRRLDEARTDVILYKTAFRTLHESGSKEDLAEMMKSEIVSLRGTELSEKEQEALLSIYDRNYPESDQYPAKFREKIFDGLRSGFENPDSRLYLLKREGEIIGFRRFDAREETEDGRPRKYAGSFNVDPAYRDAKIGNVFYQVTLEREGKDSVIEAYVDPEAPVSSFYVERYGYVIDGVTDIEGKPFLTMRRDLETNGSFVTRDAAFDESISDIAEHVSEINERLSSVSAFAVDRTELFDLVRTKTGEGWILTRLPYGEGDRDGGKVIAVFENPSLRKRVANATAKETVPEAA